MQCKNFIILIDGLVGQLISGWVDGFTDLVDQANQKLFKGRLKYIEPKEKLSAMLTAKFW